MRLKLLCNYLNNPDNVFGNAVLFTAEASDGKADAFLFRILDRDRVIEERRIVSERFLPQRVDLSCLRHDAEYLWSVTAFYRGKKAGFARAKFKTAFIPEKGEWIGAPFDTENVIEIYKSFSLKKRPVAARLFICGLGFFESKINGKRTDDGYFKPLFTDYEQRDITKNSSIPQSDFHRVAAYVFNCGKLLKKGENSLSVLLGDGYYKNEDKKEEPFVSFGERKVVFELKITYADGEERVFSDCTSLAREKAMRSALFNGDYFDFGKSDGKFVPVVKARPVGGKFFFSPVPADSVCASISPVSVKTEKDGILYDFGINLSGGLRFYIIGEKGQKLTAEFAECLNADGSLNLGTSSWEDFDCEAKKEHVIIQRAEYILSGGKDEIKPLFCWRCFRFVKLYGVKNAKIFAMRAEFIHTDVKEDGKFDCSEENLKRFYRAARLTFFDNLHCGVLSDCPHREKRPYTGDGQIVAEAMTDIFNTAAFYEKWLEDIAGSARNDGFVPYSAPYMGGGGGYAWSSAIAVVPERLYNITGDARFIDLAFPALVKWIGYCEAHSENHLPVRSEESWQLGDWLSPEVCAFDLSLMNACWYYYSVAAAERFAKIKGETELNKKFAEQKKKIAAAINEKYLDRERAIYGSGVQGENIFPLYLGIVPETVKEKLIRGVRASYEKSDYAIDTGIVITGLLFKTLADNAMADVALKILKRKEYPSYEFLLENETTLSEHWAKKWPDYKFGPDSEVVKGGGDVSHCHPMFGSVAEFAFSYAGGLDISELYKGKILVRTVVLKYLNSAKTEKTSIFGKISVEWKKSREEGRLKIKLPAGVGADILLAAGTEEKRILCGRGIRRDENVISITESAEIIVKIF